MTADGRPTTDVKVEGRREKVEIRMQSSEF
jgi:hypothetical protein